MRKILQLALASAILVSAQSALADSVKFSYTDEKAGVSFSGVFLGALQEDQNSFVIEKVDSFSYTVSPNLIDNPDAGKTISLDLPTVLGGDYYGFGKFGGNPQGNAYGTITLDGSFMDFVACTDAKCQENGIGILSGDLFDKSLSKFDTGLPDGTPLLLASMISQKPLTFDSSFWYAASDSIGANSKPAQQNSGTTTTTDVPEPSTGVIFALGIAALAFLRRQNGAGKTWLGFTPRSALPCPAA